MECFFIGVKLDCKIELWAGIMLNIFLISNMYPSSKSPTCGIFVRNIVDALKDQGCRFPCQATIGVRESRAWKKVFNYFRFFFQVVFLAKTCEYNLIYAHYIAHSLVPLSCIRHGLKAPLILHAHGTDVFPRNILGRWIQRLVTPVIRQADLIVVPSLFLQKNVMERFGIGAEKIFISPSAGVDTRLFSSRPGEKKKEMFTIGYISRIEHGKGWDTLLDAVAILRAAGAVKFEVLVIGMGSREKELQALARKHKLQDVVRLVGMVPHGELPSWYHKMDVFVFPTQLPESLGLVGLEAMACGIPVVGSNIGALREYILDDVNGWLTEPGSPLGLAMAIQNFFTLSPRVKDSFRSAARQTAMNYESSRVGARLYKRLSQLLAS